jgi:integrase
MKTTYDVRLWGIREYHGKDRKTGKPRSTYRVRWLVAGEDFGETFTTKALAESFRSKLVTAQREGVAFDVATGLPEPMAREKNTRSWYDHAVAFVDMKWARAAAKQRISIAESLANVTIALLATDRGAPSDTEIRRALYTWSFNRTRRDAGAPPEDIAATVKWLSNHTVKLTALTDAALIRKALDTLALLNDGKAAAPTTVSRKRAVFYGALRYAVELRLLTAHPMDHVQWPAPKATDEVDRRAVVSPTQALALFAAVGARAPRLVAFFACMYYAALRPAEALHLRVEECELPESGWGVLRLTGSTQHAGEGWGDDSTAIQEDRALKHRAKAATRAADPGPGTAVAHRRVRRGAGWPAVRDPGVRQRPGVEGDLLTRLAAGSQGRADGRAAAFAAGEGALPTASRRRVALAERRGARYPGRRVGRSQRPRPSEGLRQVHRRAGRSGPPPNR